MNNKKLQDIRMHHEKFRQQIQATGDLLRDQEMPELTEDLFSLYEKTGNRLVYENLYFERRRFLVVFGLLSIWYGREEDIHKLEEVMEVICKEETWALPAHVDRTEPDWRRTVDLFASETGQTLANILYLTKGKLSADLSERVKNMVIYRLLDSYMEKPKGQWRWENWENNWVAVCAGCLGSMALFLLEDRKEYQKRVIERVCQVLPNYLAGMYDDGTCPEGMSYFTYGMVFYTGFARQLCEHTNGAVNLMDSEKVRQIARFQHKCYLPGGNTVSFSDGERADHFRLGLTCYLAGQVEGVEIPDVSAAMEFETDHCYRFMGNWQDDCWVTEYLEQAHETEHEETEWFTVLPDAQWAIWKCNGTGVAAKGDHNGESHNHNDVGSFLMSVDGDVFLTDLGCGEYTREYFRDSTRYEILCNRSMGHSVPVVNGREQQPGSEFAAEYFVSENPGQVKLSFAGAYEQDPDWVLIRQLTCDPNGTLVTVTDGVSGAGVESMTETLVTQKEPVVSEKCIVLNGIKGSVTITLSEHCGPITVIPEVFHNHRGSDEEVWLIQFPVELKKQQGQCIIQCKYEANV